MNDSSRVKTMNYTKKKNVFYIFAIMSQVEEPNEPGNLRATRPLSASFNCRKIV